MSTEGEKADGAPSAPANTSRIIIAGLVGNVMEWYDFAIYGYFAVVIGQQFFPSDDPAVSLIAAFGAFAAGLLARPLGGIVFGRIGDIVGRKRVLTLSVLAMAVPTTLIAFLPTYEMIGVAAPVLIVILRIIQGLSVGGEYTSSIVFLVERAPRGRRSVFGIWSFWGAILGILLGSGIGDVVATILTDEQLSDWGWRLPFLFGSLVAVTSILVRRTLANDTPPKQASSPVLRIFTQHHKTVIKIMFLNLALAVSFYAAFVYVVTYVQTVDHLSKELALNLNTGSMAILLVITPIAAWAADRFGRKSMLLLGALMLAFGSVPFFFLIHSTDPLHIFLGECGFALAIAIYVGGVTAANVELISAEVRCTGLALAYNASVGIFGGLTPLIVTWLLTTTGDPVSPSYWIAAMSFLSLITVIFFYRESRHIDLSGSAS